MLKQKGISTSPRDIAQNILQNIPESSSSIIDKVSNILLIVSVQKGLDLNCDSIYISVY